ncbi:MAG TPA: nucleotide exchange factor GrpE [Acidobacteriota bacterium]|nr:nucleotide exchange factor GrpE [Acidobacteriota bacterium]
MTEESKKDDEHAAGAKDLNPKPLGGDVAAAAYRKQAEEAGVSKLGAPAGEGDSSPTTSEPDVLSGLKDLLQRKVAEFDNYRKRVRREREELTEQAAAALIEEMLPVVDHLELALAADSENADDYRLGVEMILKQMQEILGRHGLEPIEALGRRFDPHYHEAVVREETSDHPEDFVTSELQRGYLLGGRVLRPAKVKVAAPPEDSPDNEENGGPAEIPIR